MNDLKNISISTVAAILVVYMCYLINSRNIFTYLDENLLTILLAFMAINTATLGHLAAKIQDVMVVHTHLDFKSSTDEMKKSLLEQIILIAISVAVIIIKDSQLDFVLKDEVLSVASISIFFYSIYILWDTGKSVFIIIDEIRKLNKS